MSEHQCSMEGMPLSRAVVLIILLVMEASCGGSAGMACKVDCEADAAVSPEPFEAQDLGDGFLLAADISYQEVGNWAPRFSTLDIYFADQEHPTGIVIFVHGGSWISGDKASFPDIQDFARFFIARGYAVASINYRLLLHDDAPGATYQDQAQDIAQALRFLADNSPRIKAPADKMIVYGHSSGAHMVALVGSDQRYLTNAGISLGSLRAVISCDVHNYDVPWALENMLDTRYEQNIPLLENLFGSTTAEQLEASPISYVQAANLPPMLLLSAGYDEPNVPYDKELPYRAQERFREAIVLAGHRAEHVHFPSDDHSSMLRDFGNADDGPANAVATFLDSL